MCAAPNPPPSTCTHLLTSNEERRAHPGRLGDTYVLDLASWTWRQVPYSQGSARPARRAFHSATAVEGRVVLFGGAARREGAPEIYYQDTWLYVDDDRTWREAWAGKVATTHALTAAVRHLQLPSAPAGSHAPASAGALRAQAALYT